ncbi:hypothetical protein GE09DRAFT_158787 [Coniochaeta sp. 2T2.1]|nr:hypothetical protein GE09DRAFT_158787 [Coniochaeta sp. 2T2.1]
MLQATTPGGALSPPLKRRRVRRGTQSCWECKRRKIRCSFTVPDELVCDGCISRGVKCTSQEFYEAPTHPMLETAAMANPPILPRLKPRNTTNVADHEVELIPSTPGPDIHTDDVSRLVGVSDDNGALCRALVDAWPTRQDIELILQAPIVTAVLSHGLTCKPYSSGLSDMPSTEEIVQPPPRNAHPVLIARRLLLLAVLLQGVPRGLVRHLGSFGTRYVATLSRLVETARAVTSNDDMVNSLEGIECIMIESMYHNNAGNIRRAWVTHRRAMAIAQVLGLHRSPAMHVKLTVLDIDTRSRIYPEYMWYRLVITDRYLALVLGLPQCSDETASELSGVLPPCTPLEQMDRMESMAGGLIIQRNRQNIHDLKKTQEIDNLLQKAGALMSPQWWLPPNVETLMGTGGDAADETLRLMSQFTHYHLLAQTHLPYLLQPTTSDQRYDYNKITAVTASRELLSRFVSFRSSDSVAAYCRGVDFLAFIASTILAVAHISTHHHRRPGLDRGAGGSSMRFLVHQRPADRGLLEQTLQCMESMYQGDLETDILAYKIAVILRHLLAIEAAAANGASYSMSVSSEQGDPEEPGSVEAGSDSNTTLHAGATQELRVHIPHFGTIKVGDGGAVDGDQALSHPSAGRLPSVLSLSDDDANKCKPRSSSRNEDSHRIQDQSPATDRQPVGPCLQPAGGIYQDQAFAFFDGDHLGNEATFLMEPGLASNIDDWGLQGVDVALFGNLAKGVVASESEPSPSG